VAEVSGQVCCGALHAHAGYEETARELARRNVEAFLESGCDRVVVNAAGCGAAMKEYGLWLSGDASIADAARELSSKVRDVSELLAETGIAAPAAQSQRTVTYDAACHLLHAQRISDAPLAMLKAVPGWSVSVLEGSEHCCGGAGIYNLQHPDLSLGILRPKLDAIRLSGADTVATANPGCIMQIGAGILMDGLSVTVAHPVELLDAALSGGS
jgi:glycolate oxidase iron-sulfur subunit